MKTLLSLFALATLVAALGVQPGFAQATGTVKGVCTDTQGNPIVGATVEFYTQESGRKYDIKTNKKGEYFSLGIAPGKYEVTLIQDGKTLYNFHNFPVAIGEENALDFDLKKEAASQAAGQGISPEEMKRRQEAQEKLTKENNMVKALNDKLAASNQAIATGDYNTAIADLTEATQMDPTRDLIWFKLADAYRGSAIKQTDSAEKAKQFDQAAADYQKAIDLKQADPNASKDPDHTKRLAAYYNNLAEAQAKSGKPDDAVKSYTQAAQLDPAGAGQYYFNIGAVLTNGNKNDEAIAAFDKAIATDPNRADAYYWKGVNLIAKATTDKSGKVIPAPGTAEALNKYLELQPSGQYAEGAKGMLQYIGSSIETTFGTTKKKTTKK